MARPENRQHSEALRYARQQQREREGLTRAQREQRMAVTSFGQQVTFSRPENADHAIQILWEKCEATERRIERMLAELRAFFEWHDHDPNTPYEWCFGELIPPHGGTAVKPPPVGIGGRPPRP